MRNQIILTELMENLCSYKVVGSRNDEFKEEFFLSKIGVGMRFFLCQKHEKLTRSDNYIVKIR